MIAEDTQLHAMLSRLQLTGIRDRLDALLEEAARKEFDLRQTLSYLCSAEVEYRDQRRVAMGTSIAKFPFVRTLDDYDFDAQPSVDAKQVRDLATCRWASTLPKSGPLPLSRTGPLQDRDPVLSAAP
ncbi:MAG: ATP-binding protein [bacterium]|nr:ATP-binding protein [bacterium]